MKLRNLAFFGVMASILGINGAYAADTATVIASQAYVDAQNALDEKVANKEAANYTTLDNTDKISTTKYPSMNTLTTAINSVDLSSTLNSLDYADTDATGTGVVKTVTQANGKIAVTKGTVGETDIANNAVTMPKTDFVVKQGSYQNGWEKADKNSQDVDEQKLGKAADTAEKDKYVPTVSAVEARVKDAIAEAQAGAVTAIGNATENADSGELVTGVTTTNGKVTEVSSSKVTNNYIDDGTISGGKLTAGSVQKDRLDTSVQTSLGRADTALQAANIVTGASGGLGSTSSTTTAPSEKAVADELEKKKVVAVDGGMYKIIDGTTNVDVYPVGLANTTFQQVTEKVDSSDTWDTEIDNDTDDTKYPTIKAVEARVAAAESLATDAIEGLNNTDDDTSGKAVVTVDTVNGIASPTRATLAYDKAMNNALNDVNNKNTPQTCNKDNPCVLTYLGTSTNGSPTFRWTQMDPDGLDADI